jgi:hypothetical protein
MSHRKRNRPRPGTDTASVEAQVRWRMRRIVDFAMLWDSCERPACQRAEACRHRDVACFDEYGGTLVQYLEETARWDRFYGPYDDNRIADLVAELRARRRRPVRQA